MFVSVSMELKVYCGDWAYGKNIYDALSKFYLLGILSNKEKGKGTFQSHIGGGGKT